MEAIEKIAQLVLGRESDHCCLVYSGYLDDIYQGVDMRCTVYVSSASAYICLGLDDPNKMDLLLLISVGGILRDRIKAVTGLPTYCAAAEKEYEIEHRSLSDGTEVNVLFMDGDPHVIMTHEPFNKLVHELSVVTSATYIYKEA